MFGYIYHMHLAVSIEDVLKLFLIRLFSKF